MVPRPVRHGLASLVVVSLTLLFAAESSAATNLALNRPATASSTWSATYDPPKAVDGSDTTRWSAASGQWTNQWVRIDLGAGTTYDRVVVKEISYPRVTSHKLQSSNDGSAFTDIPGTSGTTIGASKTFTFSSVTARYVRLFMASASDEPTINEIAVYRDFIPTATPTPTPTSTPTPVPGCNTVVAGGPWHNAWVAPSQTGTFTATFEASVSAAPSNAVVGVSQGIQTAYSGFATMVRFNPTGQLDIRNGAVYQAASTINYSAGVTYKFRMVVNVVAHTYSVYVQPSGAAEQTVGVDYAFRTEQAGVTSLDSWGASVNAAATGSMTVCGFTVTTSGGGPEGDLPTPLRTLNASSIPSLQALLDAALPGDHIVLANGVYTTAAAISLTQSGTAANPIVVRAASVGGAEIGGTNGFTFSNNASHVVLYGFTFRHADRQRIALGSHHVRLARNTFELADSVVYWVEVFGDDVEIDHNTFQNKTTIGNYVNFAGAGTTEIAQRTQVHHNYFFNHSYGNGTLNGGESIRAGVSSRALSASGSAIEYNLFEQANGDAEAVSVKSSNVAVRYNTIRDSVGCIVLRHGNDSTVVGNFLTGSSCGIRFYGNNHQIYNNYVATSTTSPAITIGSGTVQDHYEGEPPESRTGKDAADNVLVAFNTLVNNAGRHISGEVRTFAPTNCTIANNVIQGNNTYMLVDMGDAPVNFTWQGNILWGSSPVGEIPAGGYTAVAPQLTLDGGTGLYKLGPSSPAINASVGTYTEVTVDMDGQTRTGTKDVGSDESSTGVATRAPMSSAEVGPNAP